MFIKICGLTDPETARLTVQLGAEYVGLLFSDLSPRKIDLETAQLIADAVRQEGGEPVGVFVEETAEEMIAIASALKLTLVQLHGNNARKACSVLPMAKIYVADGSPLPPCLDPHRDFLLFEKHFQDPKNFRFFIAGGLDAENVGSMIAQYRPFGVDVSSGVEETLAVKNLKKIEKFIEKARPGRFNRFGGTYVPELLIEPLKELTDSFEHIVKMPSFQKRFLDLLHTYAGRPTALTEIPNFSAAIGGPRIFLKREDLLHTGAHKINNAIGQCLLAKEMGKKRIIAETGAGQHGVATATACALLGLECVIYMGRVDMERQAPNVMKMELLGATVIAVEGSSATLKDAVNEALRDWASTYESTHYCLGSALGPHPFPKMVAYFQECIGREAKQQLRERIGRDPDLCIACVGGGSNAIGLFSAYLHEQRVQLVGVEAGGRGVALGEHAARFHGGSPGVLHGTYTYVLQDDDGQIVSTHSVSAGLDYPGVGPQHAALHQTGRARYEICTDQEALAAFKLLARTEGIIPALESSHALGYLMRIASTLPKETVVLLNLSGRGDKDLSHVQATDSARSAPELGQSQVFKTQNVSIDKTQILDGSNLHKQCEKKIVANSSRISDSFKKKKLFIGYLTAGDGDSLAKFRTLLDGGVDLLEVGIPFSDPVADGPVIQKAMVRALNTKTNVDTVLDLVKRLRIESDVPIVLFTYFNPIQRNLKSFLTQAKAAGVDGILIVDLPPEEARDYHAYCLELGLDPIFVVAPSTPVNRVQEIASLGRGFIYYACRKGTTGARAGLPEDLDEKIGMIRAVTDLPIAVGFGISDPQTAKNILKTADAFVVGSYFVERPERVYDFRN